MALPFVIKILQCYVTGVLLSIKANGFTIIIAITRNILKYSIPDASGKIFLQFPSQVENHPKQFWVISS